MADYWTSKNIIIKCGICGTAYRDKMPFPCPECELRRKMVMAPPNFPDIFIN